MTKILNPNADGELKITLDWGGCGLLKVRQDKVSGKELVPVFRIMMEQLLTTLEKMSRGEELPKNAKPITSEEFNRV